MSSQHKELLTKAFTTDCGVKLCLNCSLFVQNTTVVFVLQESEFLENVFFKKHYYAWWTSKYKIMPEINNLLV